MLESKLISIQ